MLKIEDINDRLYFNIASKLDPANYKVSLIELESEVVKLSNLIN